MARKIKGRNYQQSAGQGFNKLTNKKNGRLGNKKENSKDRTFTLHRSVRKFCKTLPKHMNLHQRQLQD